MWKSHVEIEDYSVVYFEHIIAFEAPYHYYALGRCIRCSSSTKHTSPMAIQTFSFHLKNIELNVFIPTRGKSSKHLENTQHGFSRDVEFSGQP